MTTNNQDTQPVPQTETPAGPALEKELEAAKAQAAENWDKYLRTAADFDNYRKRVTREREELLRSTRENLISALLPTLDNLERALDHSAEGTPLHDGLLQVQKQFERALADFGLVEVIAKPGDKFDPNIHEAISYIDSAEQPDGSITEQLQSAYKLGERLLRPGRVVVSKGPASK